MTRDEHDGRAVPGSTPRHPPATPFVLTTLLTGARFAEVGGLKWKEVDLEAGEIIFRPERTKTGIGRRIPLDICPGLRSLLAAMKLRAGRAPYVFRGDREITKHEGKNVINRLKEFGAPAFSWQMLRRTRGTFLACSPGIHGSASAFLAARRLSHGILVAEKHYAGPMTDIPPTARTLEAAMGIEDTTDHFVRSTAEPTSAVMVRPQGRCRCVC